MVALASCSSPKTYNPNICTCDDVENYQRLLLDKMLELGYSDCYSMDDFESLILNTLDYERLY